MQYRASGNHWRRRVERKLHDVVAKFDVWHHNLRQHKASGSRCFRLLHYLAGSHPQHWDPLLLLQPAVNKAQISTGHPMANVSLHQPSLVPPSPFCGFW